MSRRRVVTAVALLVALLSFGRSPPSRRRSTGGCHFVGLIDPSGLPC